MNNLKYTKMAKLVVKVQNGDHKSFTSLYTLMYQKIYLLSLSLLKDRSLAEDAVQEVFIIILNSIINLNDPKLFTAWANKIAYNYCLKELSKNKSTNIVNPDDVPYLFSAKIIGNPPLDNYIEKENKNNIINLINKLPHIYSGVIIMKYLEDMKISEISYALDISEGTVKSRLSNGKKKLLNLYNESRNKKVPVFIFILHIKKLHKENAMDFKRAKHIFQEGFLKKFL